MIRIEEIEQAFETLLTSYLRVVAFPTAVLVWLKIWAPFPSRPFLREALSLSFELVQDEVLRRTLSLIRIQKIVLVYETLMFFLWWLVPLAAVALDWLEWDPLSSGRSF